MINSAIYNLHPDGRTTAGQIDEKIKGCTDIHTYYRLMEQKLLCTGLSTPVTAFRRPW